MGIARRRRRLDGAPAGFAEYRASACEPPAVPPPAMLAGGGECPICTGSGNLMPVLFALSSMATILIVPLVVAVLLVLFAIGLYNSLVTLRNRYKNAFSQIDVQLKRRYDLIPNLVETAKGYMRHERETLEAVIDARNPAVTASTARGRSPGRPGGDERPQPGRGAALGVLGRLFALAESLPRPQGQPEHAGPPGGADLDREQGRVRPPGVQRRRHGVQHPARDVPEHPRGGHRPDSRRPSSSRSNRPRSAKRPGCRSDRSEDE